MKKFFGLLLAAVMTFSLVACGAQNVPSDNTSDDYPSGPITCIVPYAAGGGSDVLTRTIMKYISLPNNVNMVAVNVEGASGYTGCLQAAKSDPDGYTILAHNPMDVVGFTLSGSTTDSSAAVTSRRASPAAAAISSMVGSRPSCFSSVSRACMAR